MTASRFGSFINGRQVLLNNWVDINTPTSEVLSPPIRGELELFNYQDAEGIYDLTSTVQFPPPPYPLGLTPSLLTISGQLDAWTQQTVDISEFPGASAYLVFRYINTVGVFDADIQLDQIDFDGNVYDFENVTHNFETADDDNSATYAGVQWTPVLIEADNNRAGRWCVDTGGTPSGSTGRTDAASGIYYIYAECSSTAAVADYNIWLRSPLITLGNAPTLSFFEARLGQIGQLDVYLDVIS